MRPTALSISSTNTSPVSVRQRALLVCVLMLAAVLGSAPGADATFPGAVGKIVYYAGVGDINTVDPDGSNTTTLYKQQVTGDAPTWSPDGNMIALRSGQEDFSAIWVMHANGTGARRVTTRLPGESVSDGEPAWSPDGSKLLFTRNLSNPTTYDIFVVNVDGTGQTNLTNTPGFAMDEGDPAWSPDGAQIAFTAEGDLWVMNADGSGVTNLTNENGLNQEQPSWSPDSSKIAWAFTGDFGGVSTILRSGDNRTIIRPNCNACELWDVAWSPDGAQIGFIEDTPGDAFQERLWTMNADGSNQVPIVDDIGTTFDWGVACTQNCVLPPECDANPDAICGSEGDDDIVGTPGNDVIFGGVGDDTIEGGGGDDTIIGGGGDDLITGGLGNDLLVGDEEQSQAAGRALLRRGVAMAGAFQGEAGDDDIEGQGGRDSIFGGLGVDRARGGGGKDKVRGENDNDDLDGGGGNDNVDGGDGNDDVRGAAGDDRLIGGPGLDLLNGGPGKDVCIRSKKEDVISCESTIKRNNQSAPT